MRNLQNTFNGEILPTQRGMGRGGLHPASIDLGTASPQRLEQEATRMLAENGFYVTDDDAPSAYASCTGQNTAAIWKDGKIVADPEPLSVFEAPDAVDEILSTLASGPAHRALVATLDYEGLAGADQPDFLDGFRIFTPKI